MAEINYRYELDADKVTVISYSGGKWSDEGKTIHETVEFPLNEIPAELATADGSKSVAAYGLLKLLQDRTSDVKGAGKLEAMQEHFETFKAGQWRAYAERTGGVGGKWLIMAIAGIKGVEEEQVRETLGGMTEEQRKAIANAPAVKAEIARLKAEDAAKKAAEAGEGEEADPLAGMF